VKEICLIILGSWKERECYIHRFISKGEGEEQAPRLACNRRRGGKHNDVGVVSLIMGPCKRRGKKETRGALCRSLTIRGKKKNPGVQFFLVNYLPRRKRREGGSRRYISSHRRKKEKRAFHFPQGEGKKTPRLAENLMC